MSAYVIVTVTIKNHEAYEGYKKLTPASIHAYGGKFIVRGGKAEALEGDEPTFRIVVLEFENVEIAKAWWSSEEYSEAKMIRQANAITQMIVVEGV